MTKKPVRRSELVFRMDSPEIAALSARDDRLAWLIGRVGELTIKLNPDPFESLALSIVGQQLSVKAAAVIKGRVRQLAPEFTPEALLALDADTLRGAGLSRAKVVSIRDLSARTLCRELDLDRLESMENEEIIQMVSAVKGIGRWTAEMFLMFCLGRPDVLSVGDFGLQRSCKWLYGMEERPDKKYLEQHGHKWSPYRSAASFYLWEAINRGIINE
ncbi:DNA-3-methyladenine glycosylase 2 family protein [Cohnella sp. CFH 77786]|uniref:DNA-3-methyladenine glycosylase family protein n=1 Tax=Cohnella sp. CFH 77786 TaxID=2662265 RepID=UPI001C60F47E|nr:DNA-3-methyladenine glycosylase [Cohnella sp. CFH 77786]MBW5448149.1 DNA-3-methyladenine glycosylase 2 family protein [Cohnella sp. CFH 77786]